MSQSSQGGPQRTGVSLGALLIGLIAIAGVAVWAYFTWGPGGADAEPSPTPTVTVTATPSPSVTASPTATAEPSHCEPFGTEEISESSFTWSDDLVGTLWGGELRVGTHDCYDRVVFEFAGDGDMPGWSVIPWDTSSFTDANSGMGIEPLEGGASLHLQFAAWFDGTPLGEDAYEGETQIVTEDFPVVQEVRILGGFEGITQVGIGLDQPRPYEVTWLEDPARLVIDVYTG